MLQPYEILLIRPLMFNTLHAFIYMHDRVNRCMDLISTIQCTLLEYQDLKNAFNYWRNFAYENVSFDLEKNMYFYHNHIQPHLQIRWLVLICIS